MTLTLQRESSELAAHLDKRLERFKGQTQRPAPAGEPEAQCLDRCAVQRPNPRAGESPQLAQHLDKRIQRFKRQAEPEPPHGLIGLARDESIDPKPENAAALHYLARQAYANRDHTRADKLLQAFQLARTPTKPNVPSASTGGIVYFDRGGASSTRLLCREGQRATNGETLNKNRIFAWALNWSSLAGDQSPSCATADNSERSPSCWTVSDATASWNWPPSSQPHRPNLPMRATAAFVSKSRPGGS